MITITVAGSATTQVPPEVATLRVQIQAQADSAAQAHDAAVADAAWAQEHIEQAPTTNWTTGSLESYSHRARERDTTDGELVHTTSIGYEIEFADFVALGELVATLTQRDQIHSRGVRWALTEQRARAVRAQVQTDAVADARRSAQTYAAAVGAGSPVVVAVNGSAGGPPEVMRGGVARAEARGAIHQFQPKPVQVTASVTVVFEAPPSG